MKSLPITLKKGRPFLDALSKPLTLQRAVCPQEKLISFVDGAGRLIIHLLADDQQRTRIEDTDVLR